MQIVRAGLLATVQDRGRTGYRKFGVSPGGALDSHALTIANLLVGNEPNAAGVEITFGGARFRFIDERVIAWCGADFEATFPAGHAVRVSAGDEIAFGQPRTGCRAWLTISGGVDVPNILGSRATDLRGHFGGLDGRALRDAETLSLGEPAFAPPAFERLSSWSAPREWSLPGREGSVLRIVRGAEWDRFDRSAHFNLCSVHFDVTPDSNRMGARLDGPRLRRLDDVDLTSEPVTPGTVQVPPAGQPIVLLGDCQTIGGYPRIAHVITVDLPQAAQLRAGDRVRFKEVAHPEARELLRKRERDLTRFRAGLRMHWS